MTTRTDSQVPVPRRTYRYKHDDDELYVYVYKSHQRGRHVQTHPVTALLRQKLGRASESHDSACYSKKQDQRCGLCDHQSIAQSLTMETPRNPRSPELERRSHASTSTATIYDLLSPSKQILKDVASTPLFLGCRCRCLLALANSHKQLGRPRELLKADLPILVNVHFP